MTERMKSIGQPFERGEKNEAFAAYFTGQSYLHPLVNDPNLEIEIGQVTFEPGCRNHWHIHRGGYQILLVTGGEGWYQETGKPVRLLRNGDTVVTHDGVKARCDSRQLVFTHCHNCGYIGMAGAGF